MYVHKFGHDIISVDVIEGSIEKKDYEKFKLDEMPVDEAIQKSCLNLRHFINKCITKFVGHKNSGENLPIAFTFPFPAKHEESLKSGKLIQWTRPDVVEPLNVDEFVNDATGILLAMGNKDPDCLIGLALRNRANACYIHSEEADAGDCKIINSDWSAFGNNGKLEKWRTNYDRAFDEEPSNKQQL